jgi:DNA-binding response OmpR family regulator
MVVRKLIIADPNAGRVEELAGYFRARGVDVKTAYDVLTLIKLVHRDPPDAFCMNADMACDNGVGVCEFLSAERRFSHLPVVLLTDHADDRLTHDCRDLRAYYTTKGPELARRVETLLEEASAALAQAL